MLTNIQTVIKDDIVIAKRNYTEGGITMKDLVKRICIGALMLVAIVLIIFCPIYSMKVELNDAITKCTCDVSIFSALAKSTIIVDGFEFSIRVVAWEIALIVVLQIVGIVLTNLKKSYIVGILMLIGSWLWLLLSSGIVINVQSDLFNQFGRVNYQTVSWYIVFTMLVVLGVIILNGIRHFAKRKSQKQ